MSGQFATGKALRLFFVACLAAGFALPALADTSAARKAAIRARANRQQAEKAAKQNIKARKQGLLTEQDRILAELRKADATITTITGLRREELLSIELRSPRADDALVARIARLKGVGRLNLDASGCSEKCIDSIARLGDLLELTLENVPLDAEDLQKLGKLRKLSWVSLQKCRVSDDMLPIFKTFRMLKGIALKNENAEITQQGIDTLATMQTLTAVHLNGDLATDAAINRLTDLKSLAELRIEGPRFTDDGLRALARMKLLRELSVAGARITPAGLEHLAAVRALENLRINACPKIGDDALRVIAKLPHLQTLSLAADPITDEGLAHLNGLIRLRVLVLIDLEVTGTGFEALTNLPSLAHLTLMGDSVANDFLAHVHQFPALIALQVGAGRPIAQPGIDDAGLKLIGNAPNLKRLHLYGTGVTQQGLAPLDALPQLETVSFQASPGITERWSRKPPAAQNAQL
ncbi:MAG TPA: hypothetical protein VMF30_02110 [Pirellulales bacterium]|nr:hypothetical protein [Pirellulales bacterium]